MFTRRHWVTVGIAGVCITTGCVGLVSAATLPAITASSMNPWAASPTDQATPEPDRRAAPPAKSSTAKPSNPRPTQSAKPDRARPPAVEPKKALDRTCAEEAAITVRPYWIYNNQWGAATGSGNQCVFRTTGAGSTIGWGTTWDWTGSPDVVKSFASVVMGWHWGVKVPGSGLPVQLSDGVDVETRWAFSVTAEDKARHGVAYDLWLHDIEDPGSRDDPTAEVMVWLSRSGGARPQGTKQATVTIDGAKWDLYRATGAWNVYSFVRTSNTNSASLNLKDFTSELTRRDLLSKDKYLTSVEAGAQVFAGEGRLDTTAYSVTLDSD